MKSASAGISVLMLNYEFPPLGGGTGVACGHLLRSFQKFPEIRVELVTSGAGRAPSVEHPAPGITIRRLPVGKRDPHFWRTGELARWVWGADRLVARLIRTGSYDLCHCWGGWPAGVLAYRRRRDLPYLVALRGSDVPGYSPRLAMLDPLLFTRMSRSVWGQAKVVVAVSQQLRSLALRTDPTLPIRVIPNGTDTDFFRTIPTDRLRSDRPFTVLFVGRLIPRKRAGAALDAFVRVAQEVPGSRLVIAGDGPERPALEQTARDLGLQDTVRFLGHTPYERLPDLYREADVFVLTSSREGMPNVILEAMAAGLPIVTTETAAELIDGNGAVVPPSDREALARTLLRYARDPALMARHGARSRELAESCSWDRVAEWHLALYREIVASRVTSPER